MTTPEAAAAELAARLEAMRQQVGATWMLGFENFDGGHPFIEVSEGPVYRYLAYERGTLQFSKETRKLDEILYWAMLESTRDAAWGYAARNPVAGEEQRFTAFRRQEELLARLNPVWAERVRASRPA